MIRQKVVNILRLIRRVKTKLEVVRSAKTTHSPPRQAVDGLRVRCSRRERHSLPGEIKWRARMASWAGSAAAPAIRWLRAPVGQAEAASVAVPAIRLRPVSIVREPAELEVAPESHWQEVWNRNRYDDSPWR
jgi:hypothetical protein